METYNQNYYSNVLSFLKDMEIDLSPSGLFVLCSYLYLPVGIYTIATMTPYGLLISLGTTLITTGISKYFTSPYFAFSTPLLEIITGKPQVLSILTSFFYYQTYHSLPKLTKRMIKSWLSGMYKVVQLNKLLVEKGIILVKDKMFSVTPLDFENQDWILIDKVDSIEKKYLDFETEEKTQVFIEKNVIEDHFTIEKSEEQLDTEEEYTKTFQIPDKWYEDTADVNYFKLSE